MSTNEVLRAVRTGQLATVKRLLATGQLGRNIRDPYGATCLHLAARSGNLDLVKFFVEDAGHSTIATAQNGALPSHDAAAAGHQKCLEYLLQWGCPENARDYNGATVLHLSARFGHLNHLQYLVEERALDLRDKDRRGVSVLHYAAAKGDLSCLLYLINALPDMANERTENGATPAYFAAQNGNLASLQHLVKKAGANVHLRANDGMQPVHAAAQTGQLHCVIWLIQEQGVLPMERDNDGATPLHFAASRGQSNVVRWLLGNGATCDKDHLGGTPLHDAAEHGQLECAKIIVEHGCDVNKEDKDFLVASDLAKKCGHLQVSKYLRSIEKRSGKVKGKGRSCHNIPSDHEAGVYVKHSSPTSSSLSSSILSDHESSSSMGTIGEELIERLGCYEVTESPEPTPDPEYVQLFDKLSEIDPSRQGFVKITPKKKKKSPQKFNDAKDVCTQGTQTDDGRENNVPQEKKLVTTPPAISPKKSLRRQTAREESVISYPKNAWTSQSPDETVTSPTKLSPDKKELRFSTTVMVEEIARREDNQMSPKKRSVQMIPLNSSLEAVIKSPLLRRQAHILSSPPPLTNSPPPDLRAITPNRPTKIVIPTALAASPFGLSNGTDHNRKPRDVSSRLSFITSSIVTPSPTPPPPPALPNGFNHRSPTSSVSPRLSPHLSPHVAGPPSPSDLAGVVLKPTSSNSSPRPSSSPSRGNHADLIAEIKAGTSLRQTRINQSGFIRVNKDTTPRNLSAVLDKGPKVYYAADFLAKIPMVSEGGIELPDWKRRFLAKKEADKANLQAATDYKIEKQREADEMKYRDMPPWKVELLKKKEATNNRDSS
ncbi:ankyrin-1-like [Asterias rubens]|uniref:ankyrin-1-like n=1 Tax=Asterias rubens TaxID=7604 RepID=UPI0014551512|nr:ankyrin-1-like [Asterias rubens]